MKYKIEVSEINKNHQKINTVKLKPELNIKDAAYWQKRMAMLLPNHIATVLVAKS